MTLAIYGCGGLGMDALEIAEQINQKNNKWDRIVFVADYKTEDKTCGVPVYLYNVFNQEETEYVIAIGEPAARHKIWDKLEKDGKKIATLVDPDVYLPDDAQIGRGCIIEKYAFISKCVNIDCNSVVMPNSFIGHEVCIGSHCLIGVNVSLGGKCVVGDETFIGTGVPVKDRAHIGSQSIIGLGSMVLRDIPDGVIALGNPAKPVKKNEDHRVFK